MSEKEEKKRFLRIKYAFDRAFSLTALLVLFPALLLVAVLILLDDPRSSPLYSQVRIGERGKPFRMYKFRTMVSGAEEKRAGLRDLNEMYGPVFKIRNDRRITRIGRFLRQTGIDEIPQFINVLRGEMSVVGPRPPLPEEVRQYTAYQRQRLTVRPGITCIWQTLPDRNGVRFDDWVEMDLRYIRERSVRTDLAIMLKTVISMVTRQGQ